MEFAVQAGNNTLDVLEVHDVSISGIRLLIGSTVDDGLELNLSAREADFAISLIGHVRWCRPGTEQGKFEAGVEFDNKDVDNNILFFMSLRKYLDGFDDVPLKEL